MFTHTLHQEDLRKQHLFFWFLLAFSAGNINAGGFMATQRFVTHVTGFATLFGIDMAEQRWMEALGILSVPLFFLIGAVISGFFVDRRIHLGQKPQYFTVMMLSCLCLTVASLGGDADFFGRFGDELKLADDYSLLALLCTASGLQNGAISSSSRGTVRTTHLTGLTTDLGLGLVRVFYDKKIRTQHMLETRANWLRFGTILSFILGSVIGALMFMQAGYIGFLLPAGLAAFSSLKAIGEGKKLGPIVHSKKS